MTRYTMITVNTIMYTERPVTMIVDTIPRMLLLYTRLSKPSLEATTRQTKRPTPPNPGFDECMLWYELSIIRMTCGACLVVYERTMV